MSNLSNPNLGDRNQQNHSHSRYQVIRELSRNREGGRITYLATDTKTQRPVVVKRFLFAQSGSTWSGLKAYEREIQVLQGLNHPSIPQYLDSFESPAGFCMVQEYKDAHPLSVPRSFAPDEIKRIAVSILEILVYLQSRIPSVIHRDIKPENILVDNQMNVYLVDFGFARIGSGEVAMSSVAAGTFGFMPPEQMFNRQMSEATDLYGLGATLICLLTGTKSTAMDTLIDEDGRIAFKPLVPKLNLRFISWLEKMVQPKQKDRYPNASAALEALKPIYVIRIPEVTFNQFRLLFQATRPHEKLIQTIIVSNSIPETVLAGNWSVAPHPSDPPCTPDDHAWIWVQPSKFTSNKTECKVVVDTGKLMVDKVYKREIVLHTNASQETHSLPIRVETAPFPIATRIPLVTKVIPYYFLAPVFATSWAIGLLFPLSMTGHGLAFLISLLAGFTLQALEEKRFDGTVYNDAAAIIICLWFMTICAILRFHEFGITIPGVSIMMSGLALGLLMFIIFKKLVKKGFSMSFAVAILLLTASLGIILGIVWLTESLTLSAIFTIAIITIPLATMILYPYWERSRFIAKYHSSNQHLIKP